MRLVADRDDVDVDLHADKRVGRAQIGAVQRDRLARIARHRDADQVAGADDAVGRIELDPAGARQIDLHPGMGRAAADIAVRAVAGNEEIAGHEARGDAEPPQRLDHEQRIVAAAAGSGLQRIERMLGALLVALAVGEGLADAVRHAAQDVEGRCRPLGVEKFPRPCRQLAVGIAILRRDELQQVGQFLVVVEERIEIGGIVRGQRELVRRIVLDRNGRGERQRLGALVEGRDRDAVAEHVVDPAQPHRLRLDLEVAGQHAQIMAVARAQHDAVLAERDRVRVAIFGLVVDRQERHRRTIIVILSVLI